MSKDAKSMIKEARDLIKEKEFLPAIKLCKKVLKEDKSNYNALVTLAAAMKELEEHKSQVPHYLKKAINVQPDNPLAWHGLCSFYEHEISNPQTWMELVPVYCKLLLINREPEKFVTYLKNISNYVPQLHSDKVFSDVVESLCFLKNKNEGDSVRVKIIYETLASILLQCQKRSIASNEIVEETLKFFIDDEDSKNRHEYYKKYLKFLYKAERYKDLLTEAAKMHELYKQDIYPLEWICRVYSEMSVVYEEPENFNITIYYETLLDHDSESSLAYFAKSVQFYKTGNIIGARDILTNLVNAKPKWFHAWVLLGEINIKLYCYEDAENAAMHALKSNHDDLKYLRTRINLVLLESLVKSTSKIKWKKAQEKFTEFSDNSKKYSLLLARLYIYLKDERYKEILDTLENDTETKVESLILRAINLLFLKQYEEAIDVLGAVLQTSESWLVLGKIYWVMSDFGHSLVAFLNGVRADPYNWECLVYLGEYHRNHTKDFERSRKCYQKALQINPNSDFAGIGLSLLNRELKNSTANMEFLNNLTINGNGPKWALLQLGLQYLDDGNASQSISTLRNAIKIEPTDSNCWECLGDAYLARGAYTSAVKSYQKAMDLNPDAFYPLIQISNIKLLIGEFKEAKTEFNSILEKHENSVPALKGLAECYLSLGKGNSSSQLLARARDDFQSAVDYLTKALMQKSEFACLWKLLGDACFYVSGLPDKYCYLYVMPELFKKSKTHSTTSMEILLKDILLLSMRCYCKALSILKSSLLWHDLARCYLAQLHRDPSIDKKDVSLKAMAAAKEAVKLDPSTWAHWNLLGVICMTPKIKNYALAQHCFAMAIDQESNNAIPWANLGFLYLMLDEPYRANEAFSWAQRVDPAYINSWIGQAFIAEEVSATDAIDLFRHSTELSYHDEAALGYTHWVISAMLNPETKSDSFYCYIFKNMHAVTVATDEIHWYTVHHPSDPYALNAYGLLLERQGLYRSAKEKFSSALEALKEDKYKDMVLINLSRVLLKLCKFEESVMMCKTVHELNFTSSCQLALALFKNENFKESYEAYEKALQLVTGNETNKAYVLCAMASMAYMFQESNDAKTLLFQAVSVKPPVIFGLLALASLGMLDGDRNLTQLVIKELKAHENDPHYRNDVAKLTAYSLLIQNDTEGAARVLSKYIHKYPDSSELWTDLAKTLLTMSDAAFTKCAERALCLGRNLSVDYVAKITCMSSLSSLIKSDPQTGLRAVLNTVHSFPANSESWSNLIAALLPNWSKSSKFNAHWLTVLAFRVRHHLKCTRNMEQWLLKNEKRANDIASC